MGLEKPRRQAQVLRNTVAQYRLGALKVGRIFARPRPAASKARHTLRALRVSRGSGAAGRGASGVTHVGPAGGAVDRKPAPRGRAWRLEAATRIDRRTRQGRPWHVQT